MDSNFKSERAVGVNERNRGADSYLANLPVKQGKIPNWNISTPMWSANRLDAQTNKEIGSNFTPSWNKPVPVNPLSRRYE